MKRRNYIISRRKRPGQFIGPATTIACPRWLERRMFRNLQQAAHFHILPDRAARARQIREDIEAEKATARGRRHIEQPTAVALPSPSPAVVERQGSPHGFRRQWSVRGIVRQCLHTAVKWMTGICSGDRNRG